jgi:hypothetical protein
MSGTRNNRDGQRSLDQIVRLSIPFHFFILRKLKGTAGRPLLIAQRPAARG